MLFNTHIESETVENAAKPNLIRIENEIESEHTNDEEENNNKIIFHSYECTLGCVCVWGRLGTLFEAQQSIQFISVRLIFKLHLKNWSQMGAIYEQKRDGKTDQAHLVGYFYENAADFRSTTDSTKRIRQWEQAHLIRQLVNLLRVIWFESKAHTHSICSFISKGHQLPLNTTLAFHANYKQTLNSFWFPNIFFCFESNFALCNVKCWLLLLHAHFVSSHQFTFVNDDVRQRPAPMLVFLSIHTNTNKVCVCVLAIQTFVESYVFANGSIWIYDMTPLEYMWKGVECVPINYVWLQFRSGAISFQIHWCTRLEIVLIPYSVDMRYPCSLGLLQPPVLFIHFGPLMRLNSPV